MSGGSPEAGEVLVAAEKWDGTFNRSARMHRLGVDDVGAWFGGRPGRHVRWSDGAVGEADDWSVLCVSSREWWRATWYAAEGAPVQVYVDIGHPLTEDAAGAFLDLDLDVEGPAGGPYTLLDREEFAVNAVRFGYPPHVVERVQRTASQIVDALRGGLGSLGAERLREWRDGARASGAY